MPVLLIDTVCAVQEVVLQAGEQVFGEVRMGLAAITMLTYLPELFLDHQSVASIRKMEGSLLQPACWPTDRMDQPTSMGMIATVGWAVIVLTGDLT